MLFLMHIQFFMVALIRLHTATKLIDFLFLMSSFEKNNSSLTINEITKPVMISKNNNSVTVCKFNANNCINYHIELKLLVCHIPTWCWPNIIFVIELDNCQQQSFSYVCKKVRCVTKHCINRITVIEWVWSIFLLLKTQTSKFENQSKISQYTSARRMDVFTCRVSP